MSASFVSFETREKLEMSPLKKEYLQSFSRSERFAGFDPYFRSSRFRTLTYLLLSKMYLMKLNPTEMNV